MTMARASFVCMSNRGSELRKAVNSISGKKKNKTIGDECCTSMIGSVQISCSPVRLNL